METYRWSTIEYHPDNNYTMQDYLNNRLPDHFEVIFDDGTYAEIVNKLNGSIWGVSASGDGDSNHHKVEFEYMNRVIMDGENCDEKYLVNVITWDEVRYTREATKYEIDNQRMNGNVKDDGYTGITFDFRNSRGL